MGAHVFVNTDTLPGHSIQVNALPIHTRTHTHIPYAHMHTGSSECNECCRDHGQARTAQSAEPELVHPSNLCHKWRRPL